MRTTAIAALGIAIIAGACSASAAAPTWTFAPEAAADITAIASGQPAVDQAASPSTSLAPSASEAPSATTDVLGSTAGTPSGAGEGATTAAAPAQGSVRIANFAFGPETVTIQAGGTVTWTNADGDRHSVLLGSSESGRLEQGGTFSRSFTEAGTFSYVCGLHSSMSGSVVALAAGSLDGGSGPTATGTTPGGTSSPDATAAPAAAPTTGPTASPDDGDDDDRDDEDHSGHGRGGGDDDDEDDDEDHSGRGGGGSGHG